ncbi:MAG TPA: 16S rRNA (cytidine(1402)-2'-O)-methyltransferase, partial [Anaerolineales bacterium]|nr:16S rRNA (cytidine(1402)-2'-O)-methyltransferase [Anaerolineales bacterium]
MGTLYLVATPIGNLEDITRRAVRTLSEVSLIAAEDTRHTGQLLRRLEISTPLISYHEHNKEGRLEELLRALAGGDVALVSDAGTPLLNDPGYELVRAALAAGYEVSPIPGPSAPIAALISSGQPADAFLYLGYLPRRRSERIRALKEVAGLSYTLIFLETPHRLQAALEDILDVLDDRQIAVARELTKMHEEIFRGTAAEAKDHFSGPAPRGEITLVIAGSPLRAEIPWSEERMRAEIE